MSDYMNINQTEWAALQRAVPQDAQHVQLSRRSTADEPAADGLLVASIVDARQQWRIAISAEGELRDWTYNRAGFKTKPNQSDTRDGQAA